MKNIRTYGGRIRGVLVVSLIWLLALSQGVQAAERASGAKVGLTTGRGLQQITGELIGVRADAIVIETDNGGTQTVAIKDITSVRVYRRSAFALGALGGLLAGGAVGYAIGYQEGKGVFLGDITVATYSAGGALLGGLAGGLIGGKASADKTYALTTMPAAEVDKLMAKLRKKARVKNYQ